jgi:RND family efflux transporter MFP subunit
VKLKVLLPIAILSLGVAVVVLMFVMREEIAPRQPPVITPIVRTVLAEPTTLQLRVKAHGTVVPRRESDLVPQVSGAVVWVSPELVPGGFFESDQPLVRIDQADYEVALEGARASVARAESEYARAKKERARQRRLGSVASQSNIDDADNGYRVAAASRRSARSTLERAERDLARTELGAPYAGRVRSEQVDVGQFASRGVPLAKLYAVDYAEVRLPLPDRDLAYLDLVLARRNRVTEPEPAPARELESIALLDEWTGDSDLNEEFEVARGSQPEPTADDRGPVVVLRAEFAGQHHAWRGHIVRTEGELDPKSRMVQVVARVEDPYGAEEGDERPPLAVGLFVEAEIEGRIVENVFVLPRAALRRDRTGEGAHRVLVVDQELRLRFRDVDLLRTEHGRVIVSDGLQPGERVCISPLRAVTDGMRVRIAEGTASSELAGVAP